MVWPMGNDFEKYIKNKTSLDAYADVDTDPIYYADCSVWLIAEGRAMAEKWRYFALPDGQIKDWPFSWEKIA